MFRATTITSYMLLKYKSLLSRYKVIVCLWTNMYQSEIYFYLIAQVNWILYVQMYMSKLRGYKWFACQRKQNYFREHFMINVHVLSLMQLWLMLMF